ncbi:hypothetical protein F5051DRAFT_463562 [Lentinula edodes]|nr:hypothetical protein F5051DRAFT_463562 [Lentinula edodes]
MASTVVHLSGDLINSGRSTHNTRIERLWVEVGSQFARRWRAFFIRLEHIHCLRRKNPYHLWLIHHLFLDLINEDCQTFQAEWNTHPISGAEGADESPHDKRFLGMIHHGIYMDDCEGLDTDTIEHLYGTDGPEVLRPPGHTGAGYLNDEGESTPSNASSDSEGDNDSDVEGFDTRIDNVAQASSRQFLPKPVKTPRHICPLTNEEMAIFNEALQLAVAQGIVPVGYGICPEEWKDNHYPSIEIIQTGRKGAKEISVQLPDFIWRPRAHLWTLGLNILEHIVENRTL